MPQAKLQITRQAFLAGLGLDPGFEVQSVHRLGDAALTLVLWHPKLPPADGERLTLYMDTRSLQKAVAAAELGVPEQVSTKPSEVLQE